MTDGPTDQRTNGPMDRRADRQTDQRTVTPSYRVANTHQNKFVGITIDASSLRVHTHINTHTQTFTGTHTGMHTMGGQKSPFFMNTIYFYHIPFKGSLGIILPKFEVSSINNGSH